MFLLQVLCKSWSCGRPWKWSHVYFGSNSRSQCKKFHSS